MLFRSIFIALALNAYFVLSLSNRDDEMAENQVPVDEDDHTKSDSSENVTQILRATVSTNPNDIDFYLYYDKK